MTDLGLSLLDVGIDRTSVLGVGAATDATTLLTRVGDSDGTGIDGEVAINLHTHATVGVVLMVLVGTQTARSSDSDVGGTVLLADDHVAVGLHATTAIAAGLDLERATGNGEESGTFDGLTVLMRRLKIQVTALDENLAVELLVGVHSNIVVKRQIFDLNAVALGGGSDVHGSTVLLVELAYVDGIASGLNDVDGARALLQLSIFLALDGMGEVASDIECAATFELDVSLAIETGFLAALGIIGEAVGGAVTEDNGDALTALYVEGCATLTGERQTIETHRGLVRTIIGETTVGALATENEIYLVRYVSVGDGDVCTVHRGRDIGLHRSRNADRSRRTVVGDDYTWDDDKAVDGSSLIGDASDGDGGAVVAIGHGLGIAKVDARRFLTLPQAHLSLGTHGQ